jgi:uncharacterized membrane protein
MTGIETTIVQNLSMDLGNIILLVTALSCIVIAAKDLRIAIMFSVLIHLSEFIVFFSLNTAGYSISWNGAASAFVLSIVLLPIALLVSYKKKGGLSVV